MSSLGLAATSLLLVLFAGCLVKERLWALMRRSRFLFLALALLYAFSTPGTLIWVTDIRTSPTVEGLSLALLHSLRLLGLIACVALLLGSYPRQSLISGLYACAQPLGWIGVPLERLVVRVALAFEVVSQGQGGQNIRDWVRASEEADSSPFAEPIGIELKPWAWSDLAWVLGMLVFAECAVRWSQ